jgi:hypothetical protein
MTAAPHDNRDESEEAGLMLFGGIDLDCTLLHLPRKRCQNCGQPALVARRALESQDREILCAACAGLRR